MKYINLYKTRVEYNSAIKGFPSVSYIEGTDELIYDVKHAVDKVINPAVMAVCYAQGWAADENYLTFEEAAGVTDMGIAFNSNTDITSFTELQYFINAKNLIGNGLTGFFKGCTNLTKVVLPPNVEAIGQHFVFNTNIKGIDFPESVVRIGANIASKDDILYKENGYVIIRAASVPTFHPNTWQFFKGRLYVPDASVEAYKADQYITFDDRVLPLSQFATDFPDE